MREVHSLSLIITLVAFADKGPASKLRPMWATFLLLAALGLVASGSENSSYLPTIQARWDASDLVCIGKASAPLLTGASRMIDGRNRDQLSASVVLERCFKGEKPSSSDIRVLGNYVAAAKPGDHGVISFAYSGPPLGFLHTGRNLLFLRGTSVPDDFVVTVPIYETALPLADVPPAYPSTTSPIFVKTVVTRELENALIKCEDNGHRMDLRGFGQPLLSDYTYIDYLLDYLGTPDGISELSHLSEIAPVATQRDIAVKLLDLDQSAYESAVISLLLDETAPAWKRGNAALVLGRRGTHAASDPLWRVIAEPTGTEQLKMLHDEAASSLESLNHRVGSADK